MKLVKIITVIFFILALGIFATAEVLEMKDRDTTEPAITSDRDIVEVPCEYTQEQLLEGLSAYDEKDGDLTSQILVGEISRFIEKGVSNVSYVVFDSANQPAVLTRKVKFTDYKSPEFRLSAPLLYQAGEGNINLLMESITAVDMLDDSVAEQIVRTDSNINFQKEGAYEVSLETSNQYGDTASIKLPVHILEQHRNITIELTAPLIYLNAGEGADPMGWINRVYKASGEELDKGLVTVESTLNTQTPGTYEVHYFVESESGERGETWLTVVVRG